MLLIYVLSIYVYCKRKVKLYLARCSKISTAGNTLPSKNSKKAPPPVEIYET